MIEKIITTHSYKRMNEILLKGVWAHFLELMGEKLRVDEHRCFNHR